MSEGSVWRNCFGVASEVASGLLRRLLRLRLALLDSFASNGASNDIPRNDIPPDNHNDKEIMGNLSRFLRDLPHIAGPLQKATAAKGGTSNFFLDFWAKIS